MPGLPILYPGILFQHVVFSHSLQGDFYRIWYYHGGNLDQNILTREINGSSENLKSEIFQNKITHMHIQKSSGQFYFQLPYWKKQNSPPRARRLKNTSLRHVYLALLHISTQAYVLLFGPFVIIGFVKRSSTSPRVVSALKSTVDMFTNPHSFTPSF